MSYAEVLIYLSIYPDSPQTMFPKPQPLKFNFFSVVKLLKIWIGKRRKQKEITLIWIPSLGLLCTEVSKGWIVLVKTGSREVYELKKYGELLTPPVQLNQLASGHIFFKLHYQLCAGFPAHWLTIHQGKTLLCQMAGPCCCYCTCNFKWKLIKLPQKADCSSLIPSAGDKWRQNVFGNASFLCLSLLLRFWSYNTTLIH